MEEKRSSGKFYAVGVGPGNPELLTLKALKILRKVPVIFFPKAKEDSKGSALSIIAEFIDRKKQEVIGLTFPMKRGNSLELSGYWEKAGRTVLNRLKKGEDVAFITQGDPSFYSTFAYLYEYLLKIESEMKAEVIPGISSVQAACASSLIPLARGDEKISVIPATLGKKEIKRGLLNGGTTVLMKISAAWKEILELLKELELKDKAVLIERCTLPGENILYTLNDFQRKKPDYFSLLIVRK